MIMVKFWGWQGNNDKIGNMEHMQHFGEPEEQTNLFYGNKGKCTQLGGPFLFIYCWVAKFKTDYIKN